MLTEMINRIFGVYVLVFIFNMHLFLKKNVHSNLKFLELIRTMDMIWEMSLKQWKESVGTDLWWRELLLDISMMHTLTTTAPIGMEVLHLIAVYQTIMVKGSIKS